GHRIELLDVLAQAERSVEELALETALTVANASQHLQVLRRAGLVETRREGTRVCYRLAGPEVFALWQALRATGEARLAEIDRVVSTYLSDRAQMEEVGHDELRRRLAAGEVTLIDVRPLVESGRGRIAGALPIPIDRLRELLLRLNGQEGARRVRPPHRARRRVPGAGRSGGRRDRPRLRDPRPGRPPLRRPRARPANRREGLRPRGGRRRLPARRPA